MNVRTYSIAKAREALPGIIDAVQKGYLVRLTKRGKEVAVLVATREYEQLRRAKRHFSEAYAAFLEEIDADDLGLGKQFFESLRSEDPGRDIEV